MRYFRFIQLPLVVATLTASAAPVLADTVCNARTLMGTWAINYSVPLAQYYDSFGTFVPPRIFHNFCNVTINRRGILSGTCYNAGTDLTWTISGAAAVTNACILTAQFDTGGPTPVLALARVGSTVGRNPDFLMGLTVRPADTTIEYRITNLEGIRAPSGLPEFPAPTARAQEDSTTPDGMSPDGAPLD